ncbi:GNAT family N-acetyltransferase [Spirosoma jeollabukense]
METLTMTMDAHFHLEQVPFSDLEYEIGSLRVRAWRNEPAVDKTYFDRPTLIESLDKKSQHWVITKDDIVVAAARMSFHPTMETVPYAPLLPAECWGQFTNKTIASFNRMVVDPQYRGQGLAHALDRIRVEHAIQSGLDVIVGATQLEYRVESLKKIGFTYHCELYNTPERPHWPLFFMSYDLKKNL